jgi:CRP-like cAMP-binding protein
MPSNLTMSGNILLGTLSQRDLSLLEPLESVQIAPGQVLEAPRTRISFAYFIEEGLVSVLGAVRSNRFVEVGVVGCEGMIGTPVVLGAHRSSNEAVALTPVSAKRIKSGTLLNALEQRPAMKAVLLRYAHVFMIHCNHTAVANGRGSIEQRVARWLVNAQDRLLTAHLRVTHELVSKVLGVRRPSVTLALHALEGNGLVKASRNIITVIDRAGLIKVAEDFYGFAETEYESLIGPLPRYVKASNEAGSQSSMVESGTD